MTGKNELKENRNVEQLPDNILHHLLLTDFKLNFPDFLVRIFLLYLYIYIRRKTIWNLLRTRLCEPGHSLFYINGFLPAAHTNAYVKFTAHFLRFSRVFPSTEAICRERLPVYCSLCWSRVTAPNSVLLSRSGKTDFNTRFTERDDLIHVEFYKHYLVTIHVGSD